MNFHASATELRRPWNDEDLRLLEQYYIQESRRSFWAFRQYMDPTLKTGWFPRDMSIELQRFFIRLRAGRRPKMFIMAPPQHGKSRAIQDFIAWVAGMDPNLRTIFASFSSNLGVKTNRFLQRTFDSAKYQYVFPQTRIGTSNVVTMSGRALRNSTLIEYVGKRGYFLNTTVQGQINGQSLDLGVVDDPIKGREVAMSKLQRDKTWDWFTDDFFSRFDDAAGLLMIMTRWHVDDPGGRFIEQFPDAIVLEYPAIADEDSEFRAKGEALFPEHKSLEFLMERKRAYSQASWESLYQQNPIVVGGGMFPIEKLKYTDQVPDRRDIHTAVRYWDKAGTQDGGAYTAGVLMYRMNNGEFVVANTVRGQWSALEREKHIRSTAERDAATHDYVKTYVEQEPGSGGKESAEATIRSLSGFPVYADKVSGKKELRAEPFAAQVQAGNVTILDGKWNQAYIDELEMFPASKYKDQVDASSGAFAKVAGKTYKYDASMEWVG